MAFSRIPPHHKFGPVHGPRTHKRAPNLRGVPNAYFALTSFTRYRAKTTHTATGIASQCTLFFDADDADSVEWATVEALVWIGEALVERISATISRVTHLQKRKELIAELSSATTLDDLIALWGSCKTLAEARAWVDGYAPAMPVVISVIGERGLVNMGCFPSELLVDERIADDETADSDERESVEMAS